MCNIKDKILSAPSVPFDVDISASETRVPSHCQLLSVVRTKIRKKLTGAKGKESDVERQICGDMNCLQVFFWGGEKKRWIEWEMWSRDFPPTLSLCFMAEEVFVKPKRGAVRMGHVRKGDFTPRVRAAGVSVCLHVHSQPTHLKVECERKRESIVFKWCSRKTNRSECRVSEGEGVTVEIKKGQREERGTA